MTESKIILESQIREIYGRVIYTHKTHEKCADVLKTRHDWIKFAEIALSAATTTSVLVVLFGDGKLFQLIAAFSSTILLGLTLYSKDFNLLAIAEKHKQAALDLVAFRQRNDEATQATFSEQRQQTSINNPPQSDSDRSEF